MTTLLLPISSCHSLIPPTIIFGVAPHYYTLSTTLRLLKFVLPSSLYEQLDGLMYHSYQSLVTYFFETFSGTKVYFYGDILPTDKKENVLYLSNHQSAIDWSLANFIAIRQGSLGQIRYIMKEILKYLPFFGPYFIQHGCIFVRRDGKNQDEQLRRKLKDFMNTKRYGYWLVIFPEGTRFTAKKVSLIEKSVFMAEKEGFTPFENVFFPRTKAVELSLEQLTNLDAVYDLTIAFKTPWLPVEAKQEGPSLLEFVSVYGREVHIHFKRIPAKDIPTDAKKRRKWVYSSFQEKDKLLSHFYNPSSKGTFPGQRYELPLRAYQTYPYALFYTSLLLITLTTEKGRKWYLNACAFGFGSLLCTPLLYRLFS